MKFGEINRQATEMFNSLSDDDRKKAGLGYSLAQLEEKLTGNMIARLEQS